MWKARWSHLVGCLSRRPSLVLLLLPCALLASLFLVTVENYDIEQQYPSYRSSHNLTEGVVDGYLVWNPKCHMVSRDPLEPTIAKYFKRERYERCRVEPAYTHISWEPNGSVLLYVDPAAIALYPELHCCWAPVVRPKVEKPKKDNFDSTITVKRCEYFEGKTILPVDVDVAMIDCKVGPATNGSGFPGKTIYKNVHAIPRTEKVRARLEAGRNVSIPESLSRKLSVLVLGIDSVSRLNFLRSMPKTEKYLREAGWIGLQGYNKMGDNTFPNVMAMLTGQNISQAYARCKPTVAYKLDRCPFLWQNFRNAGYATAYGEDETKLNTFNYLKVGFVEPPTDYYLRPYMLACEKFLKVKRRFGLKYCTGPETSFERIFDYASNFARAFLGSAYFGFFWMTSVSHDNSNGLSSMDEQVLQRFRLLERDGVTNDTMIVFLSDHGMRWGSIRNTFVGWYEERLPFVYVWLPEWFREEYPEAHRSLRLNVNRLSSPFDMYETLRDALRLSGGEAEPPSGCPTCRSLFTELPRERGCQDAGVAAHWCACTAFAPASATLEIAADGAENFVEHVNRVVDRYKDKNGRRLCAKLRLKKIHRVDRVLDFDDSGTLAYFYMIQLTPGDGKFEVTVRYHGNGNYTLSDDEVSRINPYGASAKCLERGMKQYCHCLG